MAATQPPYYTTNFDTYSLSTTPNSTTTTTPAGTTVGQEATTADPHTGPAPSTAGPHHSNMANRLDPRIDSNLDNRAQYAPGTTLSGNVHPGTTQHVSNPDSSNNGPHSSSLYNKLDPRVDSKTGNMTTKTTNRGGSGASRAPTDTTGAGLAHGSSTSSAGAPGVQDTSRSEYDPYGTGYNPATGSGYNTSSPEYSSGDAQDGRAVYAPSTVNKETTGSGAGGTTGTGSTETETTGATGSTQRKSDQVGHGIKSTIAGIHGTGEALRGSLTSAVDKAFGHGEGAAKNDAIAAEGEHEVRSGNLQHHASERK